ncbi:MAG: acetoin utilization protein AcuC [Deltaproteobacteria bacterium]|nr:acetoin utilization protein AcuC [Deltaproteobacteria bacterium]
MPRAVFLYSEVLAGFDYGDDHPFKPLRARNARELCRRCGLFDSPEASQMEPGPADDEALGLFHEPEYLDVLRRVSGGEGPSLEALARGLGTEECPLLPGIYDFCLRAAGATLRAVDLVADGAVDRTFQPVGGFHHAGRGHAEGFCYVNDMGVALEHLRARGLRVACVDLDAHHGNGVQEAFYDDDRVLTVSLHESGETLYPWSGAETEIGEGRGEGFNVNVPLLERTDDEVYVSVFRRVVPPLLDAFQPDLVLAQLGADTTVSDPLTHLRLTNNGYHAAVTALCENAPRLAALGGGGYDIYRTARCWTLAWSALSGLAPEEDYAALLGGAMHGRDMEPLFDPPVPTRGEPKERAWEQADRVVSYLQRTVFPRLGAKLP